MTLGVIGKKVGMTQIFDEQGLAIPVTVIKVDETVVTQVKTVETDGYNAIQVGTVAAKEKHLTKAQIGHFKKNSLSNYRHLQEFRVDNPQDYKVGDKVELSVLDNVEKVDVTGKMNGHGAYIRKDKEVVLKAKKSKALEKYLETSIDDSLYDEILNTLEVSNG